MKNSEIIGKLRVCAKNLLDVARELQAMDRVESPRTEELIEKLVASAKGGARVLNLPFVLGENEFGEDMVVELGRLPHLLIGGASDRGKTMCLNSLLAGLIGMKTPEDVRLIIYDPKCVEFVWANGVPHLATPVINDASRMVQTLRWLVSETECRLKMFTRAYCRNIAEFNAWSGIGKRPADMPKSVSFLVVVIDELVDLLLSDDREAAQLIARITATGRAAGIHLVVATSRPDSTMSSGLLKSNISGRLAFQTLSGVDSRAVIDDVGAELLNGRGDFIFRNGSEEIVRGQGAYIAAETMTKLVEDAKRKYGKPDYCMFKIFE